MCAFTFAYCFRALHIVMTLWRAVAFAAVLLGACLIQGALMILSGSMSFYFVKSTSVVETAIYGLRSFLKYPILIYKKGIQILLTFIVPYAFVNFYPAEWFLSRRSEYLFHPILQYMTPVIGVVLFGIALLIWRKGVARYESTGS